MADQRMFACRLLLLFLATTACHRQEPAANAESTNRAPLRSPSFPLSLSSSTARAPSSVLSPPSSALSPPPPRHRPDHREDIFAKPAVFRIDIQIPPTEMALLRRTAQGHSSASHRSTALATVKEGGVVYTNVAVHLKGAAGSFRPLDDRPAMTLTFDRSVPGQSFHGLHKISLNNSVQDRSLLSEKICRELFDMAGVPVPRAGHSLVTLNGRELGAYVLLEGANKQFLKRYFKKTGGNLYEGGFVRDVGQGLSVNSGDYPQDHSDLKSFETALRQTVQSRTLQPLEKVLDLDRFLTMIALEIIIEHWDGYGLNRNNWRLFHDLESDKMVFIPHGMDQTFGGTHSHGILPRSWSGSVAAAVMRTDEGKCRYLQRFGELYTNVFKLDQMLRRVDEIQAAIQPALTETNPQEARTQQRLAARFKQQITRRHEQLEHQLQAPLNFASNGVVPLVDWRPSSGSNSSLCQTNDAQGRALLVISANGATAQSGFWRTRVVLPPGRYRFTGKVRLNGVTTPPGDQRAGAGLRVTGTPMENRLTKAKAWTESSCEFRVQEEFTDIELSCELTHVLTGTALFDAGSLRLTRLQAE